MNISTPAALPLILFDFLNGFMARGAITFIFLSGILTNLSTKWHSLQFTSIVK